MLCFLCEGEPLPISDMFDVDGDDTADPDCAVALVAMLPDGRWFATGCEPREIVVIKPN